MCQKKHWKVGGHRAECAALVASSSSQGTAVEGLGGGVTGVAEGTGDGTDGEATADALHVVTSLRCFPVAWDLVEDVSRYTALPT